MEVAGTTRTAWLACRARMRLAEEGRALLEDKRTALVRAFREGVEGAVAGSARLGRAAEFARRALALTEARDGPELVRSAALAASAEHALAVETDHLLGVRVPRFHPLRLARSWRARGYDPVASSAGIDETAWRFEALLETLVAQASAESRLRVLALEIRRASRRVRVLERVVLRRLRAEHRRIGEALEEREREDGFRRKRARRFRERP
jgi:V/A-type H+-transporting ATPase subunit D